MEKIIRVVTIEDVNILNLELATGYVIKNVYHVYNDCGNVIGSYFLIVKEK